MLFQTRSCFVLRLNGAELMFRGDEITSRNTLWVNNWPQFFSTGCIFVGSVETVNVFFKLGGVVFYG